MEENRWYDKKKNCKGEIGEKRCNKWYDKKKVRQN